MGRCGLGGIGGRGGNNKEAQRHRGNEEGGEKAGSIAGEMWVVVRFNEPRPSGSGPNLLETRSLTVAAR